MTPAERRERIRLLRRRVMEIEAKESSKPFIPHTPHPKQRAFLGLDAFEALYGGAAGGGKSDALLMAALQYVHVPGYAALILRRTYADLALAGAIMDRAKAWLVPRGVPWNDKDKRFTFPSGATLTFGYLDSDKDRYRYASAEFQFIGFDELTQFPSGWYLFLLSRLRRLRGVDIPLRARAASNPGGIGHDWVFRRFVKEANGERPFVPATLKDNPSIDQAAYVKSLSNLDPTTRAQLLDGLWVRDSGGLVYDAFHESRNLVARAPKLDFHLLGIDYGVTDATAFTVLGWKEHDPSVYVIQSYKRTGMTPSEAAIEAKALEEVYKFDRIVGDVGGLGKAFAVEGARRFHLPIEAADKTNKRGYQTLFNGDLASGRIKLVESGTRELVAEWLELPWTEDRQKEAEGFENHCADSALYAWRAANAFAEEPEEKEPEVGSKEYWEREEERMLEARIREVTRPQRAWWDVSGRPR